MLRVICSSLIIYSHMEEWVLLPMIFYHTKQCKACNAWWVIFPPFSMASPTHFHYKPRKRTPLPQALLPPHKFISSSSIPVRYKEAMDWYAWLSKSGLDPTLVYQYTVLFSSNELDVDDVPHFDHQFLQSMGISTAKHRLEILKLANKENQKKKKKRVVGSRHPLATLLAAMRETRRCLAKYVRVSAHCDNSVAIMAVVPRRNMPKRNRTLVGLKQVKKLMITKSSKGDDDDGWGSLFRDLRPT